MVSVLTLIFVSCLFEKYTCIDILLSMVYIYCICFFHGLGLQRVLEIEILRDILAIQRMFLKL